MVQVNADDDDITRYVLYLYAYDPRRRERRHQLITAVDTEHEFQELFDARVAELRQRRAAGDDIDPREHYTGAVKEPGYQHRDPSAHLASRHAWGKHPRCHRPPGVITRRLARVKLRRITRSRRLNSGEFGQAEGFTGGTPAARDMRDR
jgi:hypothetical protein